MANVAECSICRCGQHTVVDRLKPSEIESLWRHLRVQLSEAALKSFGAADEISLLECTGCGFRQFNPVLPGNAEFYADLQNQVARYYPTDSPSFFHALDLARKTGAREVIDLGCGAGSFLDLAKSAGLETHGLDLNTQAVAAVRARGHDVLNCTAEQFAATSPGRRFGLVTSFEVMEHVPDPAAFFRDAARLVAPGGHLAVAVPNAEGIYRWWTLDPCQWPPHHITHWRRADLERLGRDNGLELVRIDADALRGVQIRGSLRLQGEFEHLLGRRTKPPGKLWPELLTFLYRVALCRRYLRLGNSLHAHYRKPAN
jgi:2-polyprenyl-3-methyl-5-hydroxy-6-metoxy-1,4-benzoquinol methylase